MKLLNQEKKEVMKKFIIVMKIELYSYRCIIYMEYINEQNRIIARQK